MARTFYRIVRHNPPTREDFLSNAAMYPHVRVIPSLESQWSGLSMFDSREQTARAAALLPVSGLSIAELALPEEQIASGSFTVLGEPTPDDTTDLVSIDAVPDVYELWDFGSANLLAAYDTEADALADVYAMITLNEENVTGTWLLARTAGKESTPIAVSAALAERAIERNYR